MNRWTKRDIRWVTVGALTLASAYAVTTVWALASLTYDIAGGLVIAPVLVALSLPVLRRVAAADRQVSISLLVLALMLKLASSLVRYAQAFLLYDGNADASRYHDAGAGIAAALRAGLAWKAVGPFPGTATLEAVTGYVYLVTGTSVLIGFLVFSWLGFWGLLLFHRAYAVAFPDGETRRYALLVLFLPSLLFWPSSIGKESLMTLGLGLGAYGAARLFARRPGGVLCLAAGLGLASLIRPHMAAMLFAGVFVGYLARPLRPGSAFGPLLKAFGVAIMVVVGLVLVAQAEKFFGVDGKDGRTVGSVIDSTVQQTSQGGSEFEATPVTNPLQLPMAIVSVLLRPFPWEANNLQALVAAMESTGLAYVVWRSRDRLRRLPSLLRTQPYVAFVVTYSLLFVVAFSSFANFGILTRQRVQVFPFVLVLLALPAARLPLVPGRPRGQVRPTERVRA